MINKETIIQDDNFKYLIDKLSEDFVIGKNENIVVFGANGVGKSSIYKYSYTYTNDSTMYLDYIDGKDTFIKNKKNIVIKPQYQKLEELRSSLRKIEEKFNIRDKIKRDYAITTNKQASDINKELGIYYKENTLKELKIEERLLEKIIDISKEINPLVLVRSYENFKKLNDIDKELNKYNDSRLFAALEIIDELTADKGVICPICDSKKENLKDHITKKIESLKNKRSEIINDIIETKPSNKINSQTLVEYKKASNMLPKEQLGEYALCFGKAETARLFKEELRKKNELEKSIEDIIEVQKELYKLLKKEKDIITEELSKHLDINESNIEFDDKDFSVNIKLDRDISSYCTGEINYLSFLIKIYEFVSSDNKYLILDDPISSLDLINHYRMTYEIVKRANADKKIVILTHSVSLLNTINSQHKGKFKFYYLEKYNDKLHINEISNKNENIITLSNIKKKDNIRLIDALIKRETGSNNELNKLFHYNKNIINEDYSDLSNDNFIKFIDDFELVYNECFLTNSFIKIKTIVALRVWVEYKMYESLENDDKEEFLQKLTLGCKISFFTSKKQKSDLRTRLMKTKVMLNQGCHYQSQIIPFAYAIHISLDDLKEEVNLVKSFFEN